MKTRIIVAVVFVPLLFIVIFFLPPYALAAVTAIVCAVCAYELLRAAAPEGNVRLVVYAVVSAALIPAGAYFEVGDIAFTTLFLLLMCLAFLEAVFAFKTEKQITFAQIMTAIFGGALIPLLLSSLVSLKNMQDGRLFVLLPVISAFITDAGAYFSGVFLGKHKAFQLISPKKTVEGYIGGLIIGTAAMVIYGAILIYTTTYEVRLWALIIYGVIGAALTELGDLAFSLIKREFSVKDYGKLLPGHGGMLDRFDSMVLAAPAIYLLVQALPAIIVNK